MEDFWMEVLIMWQTLRASMYDTPRYVNQRLTGKLPSYKPNRTGIHMLFEASCFKVMGKEFFLINLIIYKNPFDQFFRMVSGFCLS